MQRLEKRLQHKGLIGDQRRAVAREWQALVDREPDCANAHVLQRHAFHCGRVSVPPSPAQPARPVIGRPVAPVIELRIIENHMLTEGLREAAAQGEVKVVTHLELPVNLTLLIGGLSRVKGLTDEQKAAAARYRALYEGAQIGGARVIDYSQARVDVSGGATDPSEVGIDARRRYGEAVRMLGMVGSAMVESVVCHDMSIRDLARRLDRGEGDQARKRIKAELLARIDALVAHFGLVPQPGRARIRHQGTAADDWSRPPQTTEFDDSGQSR